MRKFNNIFPLFPERNHPRENCTELSKATIFPFMCSSPGDICPVGDNAVGAPGRGPSAFTMKQHGAAFE